MNRLIIFVFCLCTARFLAYAQVCDPSVAPSGLSTTITPGSVALFEWDAVPGSIGVQLRIDLPSGSTFNRRIIGFERDQFSVPEGLLTPGTYTWRVQAACSTIPPYDVTPVSEVNSFTVRSSGSCPSSVTDLDGNVYNVVEIGSQCWIAENLKVEHYRNGDPIVTGLSNFAWTETTAGAFAVYNNLAANKTTYGLLYNGFAALDARGLCPVGWHVPSDDDWTQLMDQLGGVSVAGGKMKTTGTAGAGTGLWLMPNSMATNSSGFFGLPAGNRFLEGTYEGLGSSATFWSTEETSAFTAVYWRLSNSSGSAFRETFFNLKFAGRSVRCLQDE